MTASKHADITDQVIRMFPDFNTYINTTVDRRTDKKHICIHFDEIRAFLGQPDVEEVIWFTAIRAFERMHYSQSNGVELYDVPSSGNVFHSVDITISTALLTILYDGTKEDPCPVAAHLTRMHTWNSLMTTIENGTYEEFTREIYWTAIYGMRKRCDLFQALVLNTSTCSERDIWETSTSRRAIQFAHYNSNPLATQWLSAAVATQ